MAGGHVHRASWINDAMVTKQEIQTLLNEAIRPLERKIDTMSTNFIELKKSVEILDKKYEDVLSQLRLANERNMQQSQKLNELESALENERKNNQEATATFESLAQYLRRDCLEISGIPLSEDYSTNDIVIAVGKAQHLIPSHPIIQMPHRRLLLNLLEEMCAMSTMPVEEDSSR